MLTKPCWSCGEESSYNGNNREGFVECTNVYCLASGPTGPYSKAIKTWNKLWEDLQELEVRRSKEKKGKGWFPLTYKQKEVLCFITEFIDEQGKAPTYKEMAKELGKCTSVMRKHTIALKDKGYLKVIFNQDRGIEVIRGL